MAWTGKEVPFGFKLAAAAQVWGTTQTPAAGNLIKVGKVPTMLGAPEVSNEETTDSGWLTYADQGNVNAINHPLDVEPRFTVGSAAAAIIAPASIEQLIFAFLYAATTKRTLAATTAREHLGTEVANHALANTINRWGSVFARAAADTGSKYFSIPSWQPTSLKWSSKAGKDPVKVTIGGMGDKVEIDNSTISANFAAATYLQVQKLLHHYHLSNNLTEGGLFFTKANADGGAKPTFDNTTLIHADGLDFTIDRKMKDVHTDSMYADQPQDDGFTEVKLTLSFPKLKDTIGFGATQGVITAIKNWEAGVQDHFHLKARYTDGAAFDTTYKAVYEWGFAKLRPVDAKFDVDAGKMIPFSVDFEGVMPTSGAHLPACFNNLGSATAGTAFDLLYFFLINQCDSNYIA